MLLCQLAIEPDLGRLLARLALQLQQLAGLDRDMGVAVAKGLGDDVLRTLQVLAGIDQVGGGLHLGRAAHQRQDADHGVGMRQRVLAGVEVAGGQQRFGEGARARQRLAVGRLARRQRSRDRGAARWGI